MNLNHQENFCCLKIKWSCVYNRVVNIYICGSLSFSREMIEIGKKLRKLGHRVQIPTDAKLTINGTHNHDDLEADRKHCLKNDIMRTHLKFAEKCEAILCLNQDKNGVKGYIGAATLMELGIAYHNHRKIFLWQDLPSCREQRWAHEVGVMQAIVINGDLIKITEDHVLKKNKNN